MRTSIIKKARVEENIEDKNHPENSMRTSPQEFLGNGDTEVFSTLIPMMEDLDVLKTCRLVCKSWNLFACEALRTLPWIFTPIRESNPDPEYHDNRIKLLAENKKLVLPSPFRNFKVYADYFKKKSFLRFLKYLGDNPENYSIDFRFQKKDYWNETDPVELQTVFTSTLNNFKITKLVLEGPMIFGSGPGIDVVQPEKIRLPHLKTLKINSYALEDGRMVILCETLCHYSPLKFLQIRNSHRGENLKKMMSPGGMKSLESLVFTVEISFSYEDWKYICGRIMEIPCLKKLTMYFPHIPRTDWWHEEGFATVSEHFADSLESLTGAPLPNIQTKYFPNLREIHDSYLTSKYQFSYPVERFPLLKKATFVHSGEDSELDYPCVEEGNLGIQEFYISCRVRYRNLGKMTKVIGAAGTLFPNVTTFSLHDLGCDKFTWRMLNAICNSFPKLRSLELRLRLKDDRILSGQRLRWEDDGTLQRVSLLDFPDLEKLILGPDVVILPDLFKSCLSKMPKLKYVSFHMKKNVSVEGISEWIGDLKRMKIVIYTKHLDLGKKRVEEKRLRIVLPSGGEIRKIMEIIILE